MVSLALHPSFMADYCPDLVPDTLTLLINLLASRPPHQAAIKGGSSSSSSRWGMHKKAVDSHVLLDFLVMQAGGGGGGGASAVGGEVNALTLHALFLLAQCEKLQTRLREVGGTPLVTALMHAAAAGGSGSSNSTAHLTHPAAAPLPPHLHAQLTLALLYGGAEKEEAVQALLLKHDVVGLVAGALVGRMHARGEGGAGRSPLADLDEETLLYCACSLSHASTHALRLTQFLEAHDGGALNLLLRLLGASAVLAPVPPAPPVLVPTPPVLFVPPVPGHVALCSGIGCPPVHMPRRAPPMLPLTPRCRFLAGSTYLTV